MIRHGEKIIFLQDVFSHYIEPEVEEAALDILTKCGYNVQVLPVMGAGALFLSKAFVAEARRHAQQVLEALDQADPERAAPIVGLEPPEIYTLKHEYVDLLPARSEEILLRAEKVWYLDEFLLRSESFHGLRVGTSTTVHKDNNNTASKGNGITSPAARQCRILFHPHCHQRAEGLSSDGLPTGSNATLELLRSCGYHVDLIDSGCCGMAGTFGYEAEHFDLSMKVGELKLFPALRALNREAAQGAKKKNKAEVICSSGSACRMQIRQGTGLEALHPIVLVKKSLL
jgi:Fe-S oxidoreductase